MSEMYWFGFVFCFSATVLYDRPPQQFQPISIAKKHSIYLRLAEKYDIFQSTCQNDSNIIESTAFTRKLADGTIESLANRPAILVSSTSWTPDEDFSILLKSLKRNCLIALNKSPFFIEFICFFRI